MNVRDAQGVARALGLSCAELHAIFARHARDVLVIVDVFDEASGRDGDGDVAVSSEANPDSHTDAAVASQQSTSRGGR